MPRGKMKEEAAEMTNPKEFTDALIEVGMKLCDDLMNGKTRSEETALKAVVEIYRAVNGTTH
jgi:hypothetical protein